MHIWIWLLILCHIVYVLLWRQHWAVCFLCQLHKLFSIALLQWKLCNLGLQLSLIWPRNKVLNEVLIGYYVCWRLICLVLRMSNSLLFSSYIRDRSCALLILWVRVSRVLRACLMLTFLGVYCFRIWLIFESTGGGWLLGWHEGGVVDVGLQLANMCILVGQIVILRRWPLLLCSWLYTVNTFNYLCII